MPKFSNESKANLKTCHRDLRLTLKLAINFYDFKVLEGHRGEDRQNRLFEEGKSKLQWSSSKHNKSPSRAVDIAPWPIDWEDERRFCYLAGVIHGCHERLLETGLITCQLRWGGNWDQDEHLDDNKFDDLGHFELI